MRTWWPGIIGLALLLTVAGGGGGFSILDCRFSIGQNARAEQGPVETYSISMQDGSASFEVPNAVPNFNDGTWQGIPAAIEGGEFMIGCFYRGLQRVCILMDAQITEFFFLIHSDMSGRLHRYQYRPDGVYEINENELIKGLEALSGHPQSVSGRKHI